MITIPCATNACGYETEELPRLYDTGKFGRQGGSSAQRVPEPDLLPSISFDTRLDPIQFWKSSGGR